MFYLNNKSSITDGAVNRAIGLRKQKLESIKTRETLSNTLFESAVTDLFKGIWFDVLKESSIIKNPKAYDESLSQIFESVINEVSMYDSIQLRESAKELPRYTSSMIRFIETITETEAQAMSPQLNEDELKAINDIDKLTGREDVVEELSDKIQRAIDLTASIGEKIVQYEEKEVDAYLSKKADEEESVQLESAARIIQSQNRISRNILENLVIGSDKSLLREGYAGPDLNDKTRTHALVVYSLLETFNHLGLVNQDKKAVKNLSEKLRDFSSK